MNIGDGEVDGKSEEQCRNCRIELQSRFLLKNYSLALLDALTGTQHSDLVLYTS